MAMSDQEIEMHMSRLSGMAEEFERAYKSGEYGMAHWILLKAEVIADYLKLPGQQMSQLFGQWEEDDEKTDHPKELFSIERARKVDWHCCVKAHQTYQDIACRRNGTPVSFYSEPEYCSIKCRHATWNNARIISEEMQ